MASKSFLGWPAWALMLMECMTAATSRARPSGSDMPRALEPLRDALIDHAQHLVEGRTDLCIRHRFGDRRADRQTPSRIIVTRQIRFNAPFSYNPVPRAGRG